MGAEDLSQRRVELRVRLACRRIGELLRRWRELTDRTAARAARLENAAERRERRRDERARLAEARLAAQRARFRREALRKRMREDLTMEELLGGGDRANGRDRLTRQR